MENNALQTLNKDYLSRVCDRYPVLAQSERQLDKTSERYQLISTKNVLEILADNGWLPVSVQQTNTRKYQGYQKHIVRLENAEYSGDYALSLAKPQLVLINAHMGTSVFNLVCGYHVFACLNGLITGDILSRYKLRHTGNGLEQDVLTATASLANRFPQLQKTISDWNTIELNSDEQTAYAKAAIELRFDSNDNKWQVPTKTVLSPRRYSDSKVPTLWNTFNVVQENLIRGGFRAMTSDNRRRRTKEVKQIDKNIAINRGLWTLAEEMAKLKSPKLLNS